MSERQFFELVRNMRTKQRIYFSTRSIEVLREAKELEKIVDAAVRHYLNETEDNQGNLFA